MNYDQNSIPQRFHFNSSRSLVVVHTSCTTTTADDIFFAAVSLIFRVVNVVWLAILFILSIDDVCSRICQEAGMKIEIVQGDL